MKKLAVILAAVAFVAFPGVSSATTVGLVAGSAQNNLIQLNGDTYKFTRTIEANTSNRRRFNLTAEEPLKLTTFTSTLEFSGNFLDLEVFMRDGNGVETSAQLLSSSFLPSDPSKYLSRLFSLNTVFNKDNGLAQSLFIRWSGIGPGIGQTTDTSPAARFSIQAVPTAVPVPAAGLLLLTALGGIAALRRQKKAAVA